MQDFEGIRPYQDAEVAAVLKRLVSDEELNRAVCVLLLPRLARWAPALARGLIRAYLTYRTRNLATVHDMQLFLSGYMTRLIHETIHELSVDGLESLPTDAAYLFISNHRDIVMDSGLLNYVIHHAGHNTSRSAVGDNLLAEPYAADLMRLNKSFVVERSVTGNRAVYKMLSRTSHYIRHSLEEGESVWIAQREGRSKDGFDRTEPALLKMLALAYRKDGDDIDELVRRVRIVPVAVSYELDPCDLRKAHELCVTEQFGSYTKPPDEDLHSIVEGMIGFKGRVHMHFAAPIHGQFEDADALAREIDRLIVKGLKIFPTQVQAAARLGMEKTSTAPPIAEVEAAFEARLAKCPEAEQPYLLANYANVFRNREELEPQPVLTNSAHD
ncbi:MAG: 1-acyl-sn-glycerol-3-phosphate acyltransferase [Gammaproteobacteria bacterium]|nr:1-acyl-sn-glycerol-3-phosphate acyltransferase [Gammaproteobacteria bacterium]